MKYGQELPQDVETRLDNYIKRVKNIKWFHPSSELSKETIEKQVYIVLKAFGVESSIEFRQLKTAKHWGAAVGAARDAAVGAAREAAWGAAVGAARDAAVGAYDELLKDNKQYSEKYPNGSFINIITIYELGLYPIGVVNGKFIIGIPNN